MTLDSWMRINIHFMTVELRAAIGLGDEKKVGNKSLSVRRVLVTEVAKRKVWNVLRA